MFRNRARKTFLPVGLMAVAALPLAGLDNGISIVDLTGSTQTGRPFSISRVFAQGEISSYAQPFINGLAAAAWQCDRKTTWSDGSLRHAIISFRATINAGTSIRVDFRGNVNPCSTGSLAACNSAALDQAGMLNFDAGGGPGSWGAVLEATQGTTRTASARSMIANGHWSYWLRGPVATQVIVEDASASRQYDFGWSCTANCTGTYSSATWSDDITYRSLHPRFVATFYPGWAGVRVQPMIENHWTMQLQDQSYALVVKRGPTGGITVSSIAVFPHYAMTRRAKGLDLWDGAAPGAVKTDFNLPYLVYSKAVPPYDTERVVGCCGAQTGGGLEKANHDSKNCAFNGPCQFQLGFGTTGGRPELGLLPRWDARYLYTFTPEMETLMRDNADVSTWIPIHLRESETGRFYVDLDGDGAASDDGVAALGRPVSIDGRRGFVSRGFSFGTTSDRLTPIVPLSSAHGWSVDLAHQAAFSFAAYLVTGELYYLEELYYWAAYNLAHSNNGTCDFCRHDDWGYLNESSAQVRGMGWGLRNVGTAAFFAPDGSPEQVYYRQKLQYNAAVREGFAGITNGQFYDPAASSRWSWGRNTVAFGKNNPFYYLGRPNAIATEASVDSTKACSVNGLFQHHFQMLSNAWILEMGFSEFSKLVEANARIPILQVRDPGFDPYLAAAYMLPVTRNDGACSGAEEYFTSIAEVYNAFTQTTRNNARTDFRNRSADVENGYPHDMLPLLAWLSRYSYGGLTGSSAYDWGRGNVANIDRYGVNRANCTALGLTAANCDNPKWAILPPPEIRNVTARPGSAQALLHYTAPSGEPCRIGVNSAPFGDSRDSGDVADGGGGLGRQFLLGGLAPTTVYYYRVTCGPSSGTARRFGSFQTNAAGAASSLVIALQPPAGRGIDHALVEYGSTAALGNTTAVVPCSSGCSVTVPVTGGQALLYRILYRLANNTVAAAGSTRIHMP